jgi:hypothetical protein
MTRRPERWIPPEGLIFGQLAHGASWILFLALAMRDLSVTGLPALGWVHLVALSILIHVIPAFTNVTWRWESWGGSLVALGLIGFTVPADVCRRE